MANLRSFTDSLPPALRDEPIRYRGYGDCQCVTRLRMYRGTVTPGSAPVPILVLTELPENEGTSITNLAEQVYLLAWEACHRPWPCQFAEHYPGDPGIDTPEHVDWVCFQPFALEGKPRIVQDAAGRPRFAGAREWIAVPLAEFLALLEPAIPPDAVCDFCDAPQPSRRFDQTDSTTVLSLDPETGKGEKAELTGAWMACEACAALVDTRNLEGLVRRAFAVQRRRNAALLDHDPILAAGLRETIRDAYRTFFSLLPEEEAACG